MNRYLLTMLLALVPVAATAQQDPAERVRTATQQAAAQGIPVVLLENRVAEGRAKGVPMERIAAAVERRAASLVRAQELMRRDARDLTAADLAAGADAMEAGIGDDALRVVMRHARAEDRPVAIAVLTYLHREQGVPVDRALELVRAAMARGPEALRNLPAQAAAGQNRGGGPPEGVGNRPPHAGQGRPGGPPAAIPAPGERPGAGRPATPGRPDGKPQPPGRGPGSGRGGGGGGG
jgi:hypothetical protein